MKGDKGAELHASQETTEGARVPSASDNSERSAKREEMARTNQGTVVNGFGYYV